VPIGETENKTKLFALLQKQVDCANACLEATIKLMINTKGTCTSDYMDSVERMIANINNMYECEQKLQDEFDQNSRIFGIFKFIEERR